MFVTQQSRHYPNPRPRWPRQSEAARQPAQQHHDAKVHQARDDQRVRNSKPLRHRKQPGLFIEVHVLASVQHVEAAHPQRNRSAKNQHSPVQAARNRNPRGRRRNSQCKSEKQVRPVRESLGVRIKEQDGDGDGRELERQQIQPPSRNKKQCHGRDRKGPRKRDRKRARREGPHLCPRILFVKAPVRNAIHGHRRRARGHHRDDNPPDLPQARPSMRR